MNNLSTMGSSMIVLAVLGLVLSTASAEVVPDKYVRISQGSRFAGFEGHGLVQGLRRLHQGADFGSALLGASQTGDAASVQRLLDNGADPNHVGTNGKLTPLIVASYGDHVDVIRLLLNAGATVGLRNVIGATALEYAAVHGGTRAVKSLLAAGANPNEADDRGLTPIHRASIEGHVEVVQELVNAGGDITTRAGGSTSGDTALGIAAHNSNLGLVKLLLKLGAEVDAENTKYRQTPMHRAAADNAGSVLLALIEAGANVNHVDIDADSVLFTAAYFGNQEAIEVLLENSADKTLANKKGRTPRQILCQCMFAPTVPDLCKVEECQGAPQRMISLLDP